MSARFSGDRECSLDDGGVSSGVSRPGIGTGKKAEGGRDVGFLAPLAQLPSSFIAEAR